MLQAEASWQANMNRQTMTQDVLGQGVESCNYMSDVDLVHFAFCLLQVHLLLVWPTQPDFEHVFIVFFDH